MSSLLIVGGTGFVGRAVVEAALARGHDVTLLNRGSQRIEGTGQLLADRDRPEQMMTALAGASFDAVLDTNCYTGAQAHALIAALGQRTPRAIVISSAAVYADDAAQPPDETQPTGGASVWGAYGADKSAAEQAYGQAGFAHCVLLRPPYIFGSGNSGDRETWFWTRHLAEKPVLLPGDGLTQCQFIHQDDLAQLILMLAQSERGGTDIFNVADPQTLSFAELSSLLSAVAGVPDHQIAVGHAAEGLAPRSWFPFRDNPCLTPPEHLRTELGWSPQAGLVQRFAETFRACSREDLQQAYAPTEAEKILLARLALI